MENYLVNPVNPLVTLHHRAWNQKSFRIGKSGEFGPLSRAVAKKRKTKGTASARFWTKRRKAASNKRFGIHTSLHGASKIKTVKEKTKMNPLMLINPKRRKARKARRAHKMPKHLKAFAFHSNPKRRSAKRRVVRHARKFRMNPKRAARRSFFAGRKGGVAMEVLTMTAYAFGGTLLSGYGMNYVTKMFPTVTVLQTPLAKIGLRMGLAVAFYQLYRVKFIGQKNAMALAAGAMLPVVNDVMGMVGAQAALPAAAAPGVGYLPKKYQGGNMSLIMPPQNMAGGGEAGW